MKTSEESTLQEIKQAADLLKKGGVVVYPTDTVYGVGCKFDDVKAVKRIHQIKGTPETQQMPILIDDKNYLERLECKISEQANELIEEFWPGALTLIFNSKVGKIGVRMPNHSIALKLIGETGFPIVGTSANFHDRLAPTNFSEIEKSFLQKVDFVLKGKCTLGIESTVVDTTVKPVKILRNGALRVSSV